ncbi:MAG: leucine-rich repeat domain-containing protein [Ignavibacteria bacterium]|nr:leucine-rich repeat domain-containing protein [Ignavibacteria bacterium]
MEDETPGFPSQQVLRCRRIIPIPGSFIMNAATNKLIASVLAGTCMVVMMSSCESGTSSDNLHEYFSLEAALEDPLDVWVLDLTWAPCVGFPIEILRMKNMDMLVLPHCGIDSLPDGICDLPIEWLELNGNRMTAFPHQAFCMRDLNTLILTGNPISRIPDSLELLPDKRPFILAMDSCRLTSLPASFVKFKAWNVWLNGNAISVLPDSLAQMKKSLRYLNLKGNPIAQLERERIIKELSPEVEVVF